MMKKVSNIIFILILLLSNSSFSQDSLKISMNEFISIVKNYHPLAVKYQLQNKIASSEIIKAQGNFDPILSSKIGEKNIAETRYYNQKNIEIGIPTWYGIDIHGSYNFLDGDKLNASDTNGGLYQFGITIPLAKNLVYDKRRAVLEQSIYAKNMTEAEQKILINDLLLEAENTYLEWVQDFEIYKLKSKIVEINKKRLSLTKRIYEYGEKAAIDTIEVLSQLQGFELQQHEAFLNFAKSTQKLQFYLWKDNQQIYELSQMIYPADNLDDNLAYNDPEFLISDIESRKLDTHLSILYYYQKLNILESEKRLKWQSFLPKIDFTYNFFNKENYSADYFPLFNNNFQYAIKLEIPIFLRDAKANYEIAKIKIFQNQLDTQLKSKELNIKIETYKNEILNYYTQIHLSQSNLKNYERLLSAEQIKYDNGESSLFLINMRENKVVDAKEKYISTRTKYLKSFNKLKWFKENFI